MDEARAISKQQIAPDFGVEEKEGGESAQSFKSWRREQPSIIELAVVLALSRQLCILGSAKEVVRRTATNFTCCWHAPRVQLGHNKFRKGELIPVINK